MCAGEVVAVRNKMDMLWFRAKILQCAEAEFVVRSYLNTLYSVDMYTVVFMRVS